jgi:hypothetical protein
MTGKHYGKGEQPADASDRVIRRFFDLIERFEGRKPQIETKSAPRTHASSKPHARIRRVDDEAARS